MSILIVNQNAAMSIAIRYALEDAGYYDNDIYVEHDPAQALSQVILREPELVLSDLHMPKNEGISLISRIRAEGLSTSFGLLTSEHCNDTISSALTAGASFVLKKPFNPRDLRSAIEPHSGTLTVGNMMDWSNSTVSDLTPQQTAPDQAMSLPSADAIAQVLNKGLLKSVQVKNLAATEITGKHAPLHMALFGSAQDNLVRGFILLDINAMAILHASLAGADDELINYIIQSKTIYQQTIGTIEGSISELSKLFKDNESGTKSGFDILSFKTVKVLSDKISAIINAPNNTRNDYQIISQSGKTGRMIVLGKE